MSGTAPLWIKVGIFVVVAVVALFLVVHLYMGMAPDENDHPGSDQEPK